MNGIDGIQGEVLAIMAEVAVDGEQAVNTNAAFSIKPVLTGVVRKTHASATALPFLGRGRLLH
jgi:hypothetical protein